MLDWHFAKISHLPSSVLAGFRNIHIAYSPILVSLQGFFRRSIQQKIQYRPCTKNQSCSILRVNRNRCQYCRLKKCISVGMSRDGKSMASSIHSLIVNSRSYRLFTHSYPISYLLEFAFAECRISPKCHRSRLLTHNTHAEQQRVDASCDHHYHSHSRIIYE